MKRVEPIDKAHSMIDCYGKTFALETAEAMRQGYPKGSEGHKYWKAVYFAVLWSTP